MKPLIQRYRLRATFFALVGIVAIAISNLAGAKILGNAYELDPVLRKWAESLNAEGIDVVAGDTASIPLEGPRIALLAGMPILAANDGRELDWMKYFKEGETGVIAALGGTMPDTRQRKEISENEFRTKWQQALPGQRVFISFTSENADIAAKVKKALEDQGYMAFIFRNSKTEPLRYDAAEVRTFFDQADHHVVLDTARARESPGVSLEASVLAGLIGVLSTNQSSRPSPGLDSNIQPRGPPGNGPGVPGNGGNPAGPSGPSPNPFTSPTRGGIEDSAESNELQAFLQGVKGSWIVTENPDNKGKLFVHRYGSVTGKLIGLLYYVKVEADGTWTVYDPVESQNGSLGRRLWSMERPPGINIDTCSCR